MPLLGDIAVGCSRLRTLALAAPPQWQDDEAYPTPKAVARLDALTSLALHYVPLDDNMTVIERLMRLRQLSLLCASFQFVPDDEQQEAVVLAYNFAALTNLQSLQVGCAGAAAFEDVT